MPQPRHLHLVIYGHSTLSLGRMYRGWAKLSASVKGINRKSGRITSARASPPTAYFSVEGTLDTPRVTLQSQVMIGRQAAEHNKTAESTLESEPLKGKLHAGYGTDECEHMHLHLEGDIQSCRELYASLDGIAIISLHEQLGAYVSGKAGCRNGVVRRTCYTESRQQISNCARDHGDSSGSRKHGMTTRSVAKCAHWMEGRPAKQAFSVVKMQACDTRLGQTGS
ncbi:hypothetical protein DAEQUDRAFT_476578 [Daedalea quercina L-15889]|uniref:Uncharacterized protein n=1 Tax=Daedalea quercina L-15889 TaxID=1314783 RepID=A0A165MV51_9APHY|nr:hypothetical protein DAEQUDRAFT_476578 [Daedalea quercina L-15889]